MHVTFINIIMANEAVNTGLTILAGVSKSIKDGNTSAVPSIFRRSALSIGNSQLRGSAVSIEQGANSVLQEVGINPNLLSQFGISPGQIVNNGFNMAKSVFSDVINGNFSLDSITDSIRKPFEDLNDFLKNGPKEGIVPIGLSKNPSHYAVDKGSMSNHPKFKFLFIVEFIFQTDFQEALSENGNNMAFVVRTASRPNVNVEYEDVNLYNFRTKIPKFTEYQPVSMSFYDDQSNQTTSFYKKYLELLIPNMGISDAGIEDYESSSFNFSDDRDLSPFNSSSLQALPGQSGHKNIIKSIRLFHIWGWGQYVNVYKFHNPKISEINVSDLDMDTNDLAEIQIQFTYDGLNIETNTASGNNISLDPRSPDSGEYNIPEYSIPGGRGNFPLHYNGSSSDKVKMNGSNEELSPNLKRKSLDTIKDYTNPDAPDSDFLGTSPSESGGFFSDFKDILSVVGSDANNLINSTLTAARATLGNNIPNVNPIGDIFGPSTNSSAQTVLANSNKSGGVINFNNVSNNAQVLSNYIKDNNIRAITKSVITKIGSQPNLLG